MGQAREVDEPPGMGGAEADEPLGGGWGKRMNRKRNNGQTANHGVAQPPMEGMGRCDWLHKPLGDGWGSG